MGHLRAYTWTMRGKRAAAPESLFVGGGMVLHSRISYRDHNRRRPKETGLVARFRFPRVCNGTRGYPICHAMLMPIALDYDIPVN